MFLLYAKILEEWVKDPLVQEQIAESLGLEVVQLPQNPVATNVYLATVFTPGANQKNVRNALESLKRGGASKDAADQALIIGSQGVERQKFLMKASFETLKKLLNAITRPANLPQEEIMLSIYEHFKKDHNLLLEQLKNILWVPPAFSTDFDTFVVDELIKLARKDFEKTLTVPLKYKRLLNRNDTYKEIVDEQLETHQYSQRYEKSPYLGGVDQAQPLGAVEFSNNNVKQMMKDLDIGDPYLPFAVLNFAHKDGIGDAQEGVIAEATNLAEQMNKDRFFKTDTQRYKKPIPADGCIYTKGVKLKQNGRNEFSIISSATRERPNVNVPYTVAERAQVKKLIKMVLDVTRENGIKVIVLGPWGCGVFNHPPRDVAKAFEEVINEGNYYHYFNRIIFAGPDIEDPRRENAVEFEAMVNRLKEVVRIKSLSLDEFILEDKTNVNLVPLYITRLKIIANEADKYQLDEALEMNLDWINSPEELKRMKYLLMNLKIKMLSLDEIIDAEKIDADLVPAYITRLKFILYTSDNAELEQAALMDLTWMGADKPQEFQILIRDLKIKLLSVDEIIAADKDNPELVDLYVEQLKDIIRNDATQLLIVLEKELTWIPNHQKEAFDNFMVYQFILQGTPEDQIPVLYKVQVEEFRKPVQTRGLTNVGNTCYMNSALQCLFAIPEFRAGIMLTQTPPDTITYKLKEVFSAMMKPERGAVAGDTLKEFKKVLPDKPQNFRGFGQQDAEEFLGMLFNKIEEETDFSPKNYLQKDDVEKDPRYSDYSSEEFSQFWWKENFKKNNRSFLASLFYGQMKSTLEHTTQDGEQHSEENFEVFTRLNVPIKQAGNLLDYIQGMWASDELTGDDKWYCSKCGMKVDATKRLSLNILPQTLIIHLKRFGEDRYGRVQKNNALITFEEVLEINGERYHLKSVSYHGGSLSGGHYWVYSKQNDDQWYNCNDSSVTGAQLPPAQDAYIFFYEKERN